MKIPLANWESISYFLIFSTRLQSSQLDPVLAYINRLLSVQIVPVSGLDSACVSEAAGKLKSHLSGLDSFALTSLEMLCSLLKSTSISLMLVHGQLDVQTAINLSMLEE